MTKAAAQAGEGEFLRSAVRLMLASLTVMVLSLFCLYFVPLTICPALSLGLYIILATQERKHGVTSPITAIMIVFYSVLAISRLVVVDIGWSAFAAPVVYFLLATVILILLAAGRPFTSVYSRRQGFYPLHRAMSVMWATLHVSAGTASIVLMPDLTFLTVPMGLMIAGVIGTLILNFVTMGPWYGRQRVFNLGPFTFCQVRTAGERDVFYATIAKAFCSDLQREAGWKQKIDPATIEAMHRTSDTKRCFFDIPFLVFHKGTPVGGICLYLDKIECGLPIEHEADMSLVDYRKCGVVAEIGWLGILSKYRLEQKVLVGLFKCVIEAAIERHVRIIVNDSFTWQSRLYAKIGFTPVGDRPCNSRKESADYYGLQSQPMVLDLASMVRLDHQTSTSSELRDIMQPYAIERFFKLLAIQELVQLSINAVHRIVHRSIPGEVRSR